LGFVVVVVGLAKAKASTKRKIGFKAAEKNGF